MADNKYVLNKEVPFLDPDIVTYHKLYNPEYPCATCNEQSVILSESHAEIMHIFPVLQ